MIPFLRSVFSRRVFPLALCLVLFTACGASDQYKEDYRLGYRHGLDYMGSLNPRMPATRLIATYGIAGDRVEEPDAFIAGFEDAASGDEKSY